MKTKLRHGALLGSILGLALVAHLAGDAAGADTGPVGHAGAHNLVAIEFHDWPPSELSVSSGFLGVPDSLGRFPADFHRYDRRSGNSAARGVGAGNLLVFQDLEPGTYRVALFLLEQSKLFRKLLSSKVPATYDRCLVYQDSLAALTFTVGDGDLTYLGCVVRRMRPDPDSTDVWATSNHWAPGNEAKAWKSLAKRKQFAPWRERLESRAAVLDSTPRKRKG